MGACLKTESYNSSDGRSRAEQKMQWYRQGVTNHGLWTQILVTSLDQAPFYFLEQVQNQYTDLLGAFLCPDALLAVFTEFKRFLYLLAIESSDIAKERAGYEEQANGDLTSLTCKYVPSPSVDRMWRILISNEPLYRKMCFKFFHGYRFDRDSLAITQSGPYQETLEKIHYEFPRHCQHVWPDKLPETQDSPYMLIKISDFVDFHTHFCKQARKDGEISILGEFDALKKKLARDQDKINDQLREAEDRDLIGGDTTEKEKFMLESFLSHDLKDTIAEMEDEPDLPRQNTLIKQVSNEPDQIKKLMKNFANKRGPQMKKHKSQKSQPRQSEDGDGLIKKKNKTDFGVYNLKQAEQDKDIHHDWLKQDWGVIEATIWPKLRQSVIAPFAKRVIAVELNSSRELCNSILDEYKKFLLLTQLVKPEYRPIPSHMVELAWKYHMAETAAYRKFSQDNFKGNLQSFRHFFYQVNEKAIEDYEQTLSLYEAVFGNEAPYCLWPSPQRRFDFNTIYSAKTINIPGYMHAMIQRIKERADSPKLVPPKQSSKQALAKKIMDYEKKKSLSGMKFQISPEFGNQQLIGKNERDFEAEVLQRDEVDESFLTIKGQGERDSMFYEGHK